MQRAEEQAKTSSKPAPTSLTIWVHNGQTLAMINTMRHHDPSKPQATVSCTIADIMRAAKEPPRAAQEQPFYDLQLRYYDQQWAWHVDRRTNVNAATCAQLR